MQFKDIIGQSEIKSKLIDTVKENRISHAQLFLGTEGIGKLALAIAYAQYICCENKAENDSCGICPSCSKYQKLIHPDLHFVFPITTPKSGKKISEQFITKWREKVNDNPYFNLNQWIEIIGAENKQGLIYTDESREIMYKINLKSFESEYKIMIIWMAEKMHISIANKMLQIFEEPPEKTLFILISEQTDVILPTIISRTQIIKIPKIDDLSLRQYLKEKHQIDDNEISDIIRLSEGNMINVLENINSSGLNEINFDLFMNMMRFSFSLKYVDINNLTEEFRTLGRERQKQFLKYAMRMIREYYMLSSGNKVLSKLTDTETNKDEKFASVFPKFINNSNVQKIYEELNKAYFHITRNGYARIIFFDMMIKINKYIAKKPS